MPRIAAGRSMPGRRASLRRASRMRAAVSGEWLTSVTGSRWARMRGERRAPGTRADDGHPRRRTGETARTRATPRRRPSAPPAYAPCDACAGRFSRICSRNTSRIGVPSKPYASRSRFSRYRRYEKWIERGVGREEHERRRRDAGLGRVPDLRAAAADHRRRRALDRGRDQPVELAGRDPPSSLAPHVDRELEHLLDALAGLGPDRDDRGVVDERRARAGGWPTNSSKVLWVLSSTMSHLLTAIRGPSPPRSRSPPRARPARSGRRRRRGRARRRRRARSP